MELTDRKKKILRAIVESYIQTAEPVGSKYIAQMPDLAYSSATIRNEMADLTAMGYLEQPHTSAGRVPSPAGYRLYIDELMQDYRQLRMQEFDTMISQVGKIVSNLTNLPAYAMATHCGAVTVKRFEIIMADAGSFILVVMTSNDVVKNKLIKLPLSITEADLKLLSAVLNASLAEVAPDGITQELVSRITRSAGPAASLIPIIIDFTTQVLLQQQRDEIYLTGQMKLLKQPEYHDVEKAEELLTSLDEEMLSNLPAAIDRSSPVQVLVGPENIAKELKDTSVVVTRFDIGDGMQGMIGVVGPTRMDYAQITARLSYFAEGLGRMFGNNELPAPKEPEKTEQEDR